MAVHLILGAARSGKSAYAQRAAEKTTAVAGTHKPLMIATAEALDAEMVARIAAHRQERGDAWTTVETPIALAETIRALTPGTCAVVDCLTLWLSNLMLRDQPIAPAIAELVNAVQATSANIWLVSNEVGWGIVPETKLGRQFRDEAGRLHQQLAAVADEVVLLVAGIPVTVKPRA